VKTVRIVERPPTHKWTEWELTSGFSGVLNENKSELSGGSALSLTADEVKNGFQYKRKNTGEEQHIKVVHFPDEPEKEFTAKLISFAQQISRKYANLSATVRDGELRVWVRNKAEKIRKYTAEELKQRRAEKKQQNRQNQAVIPV